MKVEHYCPTTGIFNVEQTLEMYYGLDVRGRYLSGRCGRKECLGLVFWSYCHVLFNPRYPYFHGPQSRRYPASQLGRNHRPSTNYETQNTARKTCLQVSIAVPGCRLRFVHTVKQMPSRRREDRHNVPNQGKHRLSVDKTRR